MLTAVRLNSDGEAWLAQPYTVTLEATENGTLTWENSDEPYPGSLIRITAEPDEGWQTAEVTYTCNDVTAALDPEEGVYSFTMPVANVTVSAVFEEAPLPAVITFDPGDDGAAGSMESATVLIGSSYPLPPADSRRPRP